MKRVVFIAGLISLIILSFAIQGFAADQVESPLYDVRVAQASSSLYNAANVNGVISDDIQLADKSKVDFTDIELKPTTISSGCELKPVTLTNICMIRTYKCPVTMLCPIKTMKCPVITMNCPIETLGCPIWDELEDVIREQDILTQVQTH